jgi:hypothetical protein
MPPSRDGHDLGPRLNGHDAPPWSVMSSALV